jgi:hypothetical protein
LYGIADCKYERLNYLYFIIDRWFHLSSKYFLLFQEKGADCSAANKVNLLIGSLLVN